MILSIQYLRGIAALSVAVFHVTLIASQTFYPVPVIHSAAAGVDVFFVISGFIMWETARKQKPLKFLRNRVARIVPLYWLMTFALYLGWVAFNHGIPPIEHLIKSLLFIPYVAANGEMTPVVVAGWTLNYEMFFYALFAVSLLAGRAAAVVLLPLIGVLVIIGAAFPLNPALRFYTGPLLLEFAFGLLIGIVFCSIGRPSVRFGLAFFTLGIVVLGCSEMAAPTSNSFWRVLIWGVPAFCVVGGSLAFEKIVYSRFLEALGNASYSIYLTHLLTIFAVKKVITVAGFGGWAGAVLLIGAGVCASIVVGFAVYAIIEHPLLQALKRKNNPLQLVQGSGA